MREGGVSPSVLRPVAALLWRAVPAAAARPFIFRRGTWRAALAVWMLLLVACVVLLIPIWPVYVALAFGLLVIEAGRFGWAGLAASSDRTIVLLSRLAASNPEAEARAHDQLDAIVERLQAGDFLARHIEIRTLPAPLSRGEAEKLMEATPASCVVFGAVRVAGDVARWRAEMLLRWPGQETTGGSWHVYGNRAGEMAVEEVGRRQAAPPRHEAVIDAAQPVAHLAAETFEAHHADRIEGTLYALVADRMISEGDGDQAAVALSAAERFRSALSTQTRASVEVSKAFMAPPDRVRETLRQLEHAGETDADHVDLWTTAVLLAFTSDQPLRTRLRFAERAMRAAPSDPTARYNFAEVLGALGQGEKALAELRGVARTDAYASRPYVHSAIGILSYNLRRFEEARDAYSRAVELRPTAALHVYLGDAHRQLGEVDAARHHYRQALLMDPTLVEAHRGYWYVVPPDGPDESGSALFDRLAGPLLAYGEKGLRRRRIARSVLWRLLCWHYHRHPEDSRVHYMLGAHALLRGDFDFAEERLSFALQLLPNDLEALARRGVVRALSGNLRAAEADLRALKTAPRLPGKPGDVGYPFAAADSEEVRAFEQIKPFLDEPRLAESPYSEAFHRLQRKVFPRAWRIFDSWNSGG